MTPSRSIQYERDSLNGNSVSRCDFRLLEFARIYANALVSRSWAKCADLQYLFLGEDMTSMLGPALCRLAENINRMTLVLGFCHVFQIIEAIIASNSVFVIDLFFVRGERTNKGSQHQLMSHRALTAYGVTNISTRHNLGFNDTTIKRKSSFVAYQISGIVRNLTPLLGAFHKDHSSCNKAFAQ